MKTYKNADHPLGLGLGTNPSQHESVEYEWKWHMGSSRIGSARKNFMRVDGNSSTVKESMKNLISFDFIFNRIDLGGRVGPNIYQKMIENRSTMRLNLPLNSGPICDRFLMQIVCNSALPTQQKHWKTFFPGFLLYRQFCLDVLWASSLDGFLTFLRPQKPPKLHLKAI